MTEVHDPDGSDCTYERDGFRCVFGGGHAVRYHHLTNGQNDPIGDAVAPPSSAVASVDDFLRPDDVSRG